VNGNNRATDLRRREHEVPDHERNDQPDLDAAEEVIERLEWADGRPDDTPHKRWHDLTRRTALTGGAAGVAAFILEACGGGKKTSSTGTSTAAAAGSPAAGVFGSQPKMRFTFVNHVTTNPFFVPTKYGAEDACKLLGCSYQWTGSQSSNVKEMVNATDSAITAGAAGIAIALVDLKAFNGPTDNALAKKIPVVGYNADAAGNNRLAYIGQDLFVSGQQMGEHILSLVPSGDVALFIATPGSLNIQPRIDGALDTIKKKGGGKVTGHTVATGAAVPKELSTIDAYWQGHPSTKGMFAVDAGSTQGVAQTIQKYKLRGKGVKGGGYDLLPIITKLLASDQLDFTIDQQPYLQGFLPVLQLYMYKASGTLSGIADVNTGLKFLDKDTVVPYNTTKSRYEGSSSSAGVSKS
jgi:simple sugar transport system substrate-binding protein